MLRNTRVTVQEIAPPWVDTDLIKKSGDPRAMPLDAFIAETMTGLGTEVEEVVVEAVRSVRDNPGAKEHAMVDAFNAGLVPTRSRSETRPGRTAEVRPSATRFEEDTR